MSPLWSTDVVLLFCRFFLHIYYVYIIYKLGDTYGERKINNNKKNVQSTLHTLANCVVTTFVWLVAEVLNVNITCEHWIKLMREKCVLYGQTTLNFMMLFIVLNIYNKITYMEFKIDTSIGICSDYYIKLLNLLMLKLKGSPKYSAKMKRKLTYSVFFSTYLSTTL